MVEQLCSSPFDFCKFVHSEVDLISLFLILYNVHGNLLPQNSNHSEGQTQSLSTRVSMPSTFMCVNLDAKLSVREMREMTTERKEVKSVV